MAHSPTSSSKSISSLALMFLCNQRRIANQGEVNAMDEVAAQPLAGQAAPQQPVAAPVGNVAVEAVAGVPRPNVPAAAANEPWRAALRAVLSLQGGLRLPRAPGLFYDCISIIISFICSLFPQWEVA
jgi:hypothetical protein